MSEAPYFIDAPSGRRLEESKLMIRVLPRATDRRLRGRSVPGDPHLGGIGREDVSTFFVSPDVDGDGIVYLQRDGDPGSVVTQEIGELRGRLATAQEVMR